MTFNGYQQWTKTTAIYPEEVAIPYLTAGLAEEAGEVAGKYKKHLRDKTEYGEFSELAKAELGDVLWYLARYADELGYSLSEVMQYNVDKLSSRKERGVLQGSGDER